MYNFIKIFIFCISVIFVSSCSFSNKEPEKNIATTDSEKVERRIPKDNQAMLDKQKTSNYSSNGSLIYYKDEVVNKEVKSDVNQDKNSFTKLFNKEDIESKQKDNELVSESQALDSMLEQGKSDNEVTNPNNGATTNPNPQIKPIFILTDKDKEIFADKGEITFYTDEDISKKNNKTADKKYDTMVGNSNIFVQVGAYSDPNNVKKVMDDLSKYGTINMTKIKRNGKTLHVLKLGPIDSVDKAKNLQKDLGKDGYTKTMLITK